MDMRYNSYRIYIEYIIYYMYYILHVCKVYCVYFTYMPYSTCKYTQIKLNEPMSKLKELIKPQSDENVRKNKCLLSHKCK